ncbi:MAG: 16S rRNA (guanine(966)-N(2))-methyltransferase RsmD [Acidimicrobiia bacterium]
MRVIAGTAGGRRLTGPEGDETRPMMDRAKEALFSSLGAVVVDAAVLDLFAGSGALGIEALSRGAASATFVEKSKGALRALRANLETLGLEGRVVGSDVGAFLARVEPGFDLVFVDPPYRLSLALVEEVLAAAAALLANGGVIVVHRRAGEPAPAAPDSTPLADDRRYGDTQLWIYRKGRS